MNRHSGWFAAGFLLLLLGGGLGLLNGPPEWSDARAVPQRAATILEIGYGLAGLLAAGALWVGHRWTLPLATVWAVLITATGAAAPVVWGGAQLSAGILSGMASALIAAVILWVVRRALGAGGAA